VSSHEHEHEPVPGLPEELPAGERMLWQGAPSWRALARRALHVRKVAAYFVLLAGWHVVEVMSDGTGLIEAVRGATWLVVLGAAAIGVLMALAWALARSTLYTVTSRRVVMRFGVALPMSVNLPLKLVEAVDLRRHDDGTADLPLTLQPGSRVGYLLTWPHVQPWHLFRVRPMLRGLADGEVAAKAIMTALGVQEAVPAAATTRPARETGVTPRPATAATA
jgi:hypothetical protein